MQCVASRCASVVYRTESASSKRVFLRSKHTRHSACIPLFDTQAHRRHAHTHITAKKHSHARSRSHARGRRAARCACRRESSPCCACGACAARASRPAVSTVHGTRTGGGVDKHRDYGGLLASPLFVGALVSWSGPSPTRRLMGLWIRPTATPVLWLGGVGRRPRRELPQQGRTRSRGRRCGALPPPGITP